MRIIAIVAVVAIVTITVNIDTVVSTASSVNMAEIEEANRSQRNLFIIYTVFLVLTVIFSVLVWRSSNKYQDTVRQHADARIAEANRKSKEVEQQNLILRSEVAKLQIEAANAQRALLEVQERIAPRHLSEDQKNKLRSILKGQPKGEITIECVGAIGEAFDFAKEIYDVLVSIGWKVQGVESMIVPGEVASGILIAVRSHDSPSAPKAKTLRAALKRIGLETKEELRNHLSENEIELLVGAKK